MQKRQRNSAIRIHCGHPEGEEPRSRCQRENLEVRRVSTIAQQEFGRIRQFNANNKGFQLRWHRVAR